MALQILVAALISAQADSTLDAQNSRDVRDILQALVQAIEPEPSDRFVAGRGFHAAHRSALARITPRDVFDLRPNERYLVQPDEVVFESLKLSGRSATIVLTYGPVPANVILTCGETVTFAARNGDRGWEIDREESWVKCANQGVRAPSEREEQLRQVLRLSLNQVRPESDVRIVAGSQLSAETRTMLERLVPVLDAARVQTEVYVLPPGHLQIHDLSLSGETATFEATMGEVPRNASLNCGVTSKMRLRRKAGGWTFEEISGTVC